MLVRSYLQSMSDMNITGLCHSVQGTAEMLYKMDRSKKKSRFIIHVQESIIRRFILIFEVDGKDAYPDLYKAIEREVAAEPPVRIRKCSRNLDILITESSGT